MNATGLSRKVVAPEFTFGVAATPWASETPAPLDAAGRASSNAGLGANHALADSLGGWLDLPHGECNAILLPHVRAYNFMAAPERFQQIERTLGLEARHAPASSAKLPSWQKWRACAGPCISSAVWVPPACIAPTYPRWLPAPRAIRAW